MDSSELTYMKKFNQICCNSNSNSNSNGPTGPPGSSGSKVFTIYLRSYIIAKRS